MHCTLDHLTVTAPTLEIGADHVFRALGVTPGIGGSHPRMGTHNQLLRLGRSRFLEVIAVDPAAPPPPRTRWFGLDSGSTASMPRLAGWVARTDDLIRVPEALLTLLGPPNEMARGSREWLITIPTDGSLPMEGCLPSLIQWTTPSSPAGCDLPESGCDLVGLTLSHPQPTQLAEILSMMGLDDAIATTKGAPGISAKIMTPVGLRILGIL